MPGLVTLGGLLRLLAGGVHGDVEPAAVHCIMKLKPVAVATATPVRRAAELMRRHRLGSLPVVENDRLAGIITVYDVLETVAQGDAPAGGGRQET